jgi:hypothetical protein
MNKMRSKNYGFGKKGLKKGFPKVDRTSGEHDFNRRFPTTRTAH